MQFRDLSKQYQFLKPLLDASVIESMASAQYIGGSTVSRLEERLADYVGVNHCVTCGNGTDALQLALLAWGIGPGDAVIVPDFTFFSSGEVVSAVGATPIFIRVIDETFNLDPAQIEPAFELAIQHRLNPKALIAVDLFGQPADYPAIRAKCEELDLLILEDGAQGFGGSIQGQSACSFGDISTTSFFPAKPLGCYGDGGAVFTDNEEWASLVRSFAVHGKGSMKYDNVRIGMNSRLDALQATILLVKLDAFVKYELDAVNKIAELYTSSLLDIALQGYIEVPKVPQSYISSWAQYTVRLASDCTRSVVQARLSEDGVPTMVYYPKPMHDQLAFFGKSYATAECLDTQVLCETVLSLPMGPYMSENDVAFVCDAFRAAI